MDKHHIQYSEYLFSAISMALTEHGKVYPTYVMIIQDEMIPVIAAPKENLTLAEYERAVNQAAMDVQPDAIILICEQWMVSRQKDDPETQLLIDGVLRASEVPDKESYLTLIYTDIDGNSESLVAKIDSDPAGTRFTRDQSWIKGCVSNLIKPWKAEEITE